MKLVLPLEEIPQASFGLVPQSAASRCSRVDGDARRFESSGYSSGEQDAIALAR